MNIALFGGSFDPIHNGHVEIAKCCINSSANIDKVWFIPTYKSWIKGKASPFDIRCEMIDIAIKKYSNMELKTYEKNLVEDNNLDYSYTSELIKMLKDKYKDYNFYFLCGLDSILDIKTWHEYEYILQNITFLISSREYNGDISTNLNKYTDYFKELEEKYNFKYQIINTNNINISSSYIKECIKNDNLDAAKEMLNEDVYKYIIDNIEKINYK